MSDREELKEVASTIEDLLHKKEPCKKKLWEGVLSLLKESNFGEENASTRIEFTDVEGGLCGMDSEESFNRLERNTIGICEVLLGELGSISAMLDTGSSVRLMVITFKPRCA
ncbi:MAG: hypothetical protein ACQESA_03595 [Patescibacteria group bacterium]